MYVAEILAAPGHGSLVVTVLEHTSRTSAVNALANQLHISAARPAVRNSGSSATYHAAAEMFQACARTRSAPIPELTIGARIYRVRRTESSNG